MVEIDTEESLRAEIGLEKIKVRALLKMLKELVAISGEANIPMVNVKSVRRMGHFVDVTTKAKTLIAKIESVECNCNDSRHQIARATCPVHG